MPRNSYLNIFQDSWVRGRGFVGLLVSVSTHEHSARHRCTDARKNGDLIAHVRHEFPVPDAPFFKPGTDRVQIHSSVAPADGETVILKNYPNSFLKTNLKELLDNNGVQEVTVVGAMSHMCIDATVRASSDFGYKTTVLHDACATRDLEFGGRVVPAAQVHAALMSALEFGSAKVVAMEAYLER